MKTLLSRLRPPRPLFATGDLTWLRLRYGDPAGPTRCLQLLARPDVGGRILLYYLPGALVHELHLGVTIPVVALLPRLARDFGLHLRRSAPAPLPAPLIAVPVTSLPWHTGFLAQLAGTELTCAQLEAGDRPLLTDSGPWSLPAEPPPGLRDRPVWAAATVPTELAHRPAETGSWPVGRSRRGQSLTVAGRLSVYGRPAATAAWLVALATELLAIDPAGLVIVDAAGDLVPRLKRRQVVTRLLGQQLAYLDCDAGEGGMRLNPLAPLPGETVAAVATRWRRWFAGMDVPPLALALLNRAAAAGIASLPALQAWLLSQAQERAATSLALALRPLLVAPEFSDRSGANVLTRLASGALLVSCRTTTWARQQLLRAICLAAFTTPGTRLICHGRPWPAAPELAAAEPAVFVVSGGPTIPGATPVLVQSPPAEARTLGALYLDGDPQLVENLQLLRRGEGIVIYDKVPVLASWLEGDQ